MTAVLEQYEQELTPDIANVRALVQGMRLVFFLPAYNEEENIERVVTGLREYLLQLDFLQFHIVIVNDGSRDATGAIADTLERSYPEIGVIHHNPNRGYGGALISGFKSAAQSGWDIWAFFDGDGQFGVDSVGTVLHKLCESDADMVVGRRIGRKDADSKFRFLLGRAWHFVSKALMGRGPNGQPLLSVMDVDCGIKAGYNKPLADIVDSFGGKAAAVSPELIARANLAGHRIGEVGVTHLPRLAGESTGDKPMVMLKSAISIAELSLRLRLQRRGTKRLLGAVGLLLSFVAIFATVGRKHGVR